MLTLSSHSEEDANAPRFGGVNPDYESTGGNEELKRHEIIMKKGCLFFLVCSFHCAMD